MMLTDKRLADDANYALGSLWEFWLFVLLGMVLQRLASGSRLSAFSKNVQPVWLAAWLRDWAVA